MSRIIKGGSANQSTVIRFVDSTDGTPENGVTSATAGLALWYRREGGLKVDFVAVNDLANLNDAHNDEGLLLIDDGYYRFDLPDAAVAAGTGVMVGGTATGMVVIGAYHPIVAYDPGDTVRLGLTALPNAAADGVGGLPISDAGGLDMDAILADTNEIQGKLPTNKIMGSSDVANHDGDFDAVTLANGAHGGAAATFQFASGTSGIITGSLSGGVGSVAGNIGGNLTGNVLGTCASLIGFNVNGSGLSAIPWNAAWDAQVESECNDALIALGYTLARAGYLDELAAANIPADIDTLIARLTAVRAANLDELGAANVPADINTLLARLTAVRAAYLDVAISTRATPADVAVTVNPTAVTVIDGD